MRWWICASWITSAATRLTGSFCTRAGQHGWQGAPKNLKVQPKRPVVNVLQVQPHPVLEIADIVAPADLPEAGEARLDSQPPPMGQVIEPLDFVHRQRARADQAHLATQHVEKLGELVEAVFA